MSAVTAPSAPGAMGVAVHPQAMLGYLGALDAWVSGRRAELAALDAEILANPQQGALTPDMALSLALWQAVKIRYDQLLLTWDSGRVGPAECERLAALIWGRLDASAAPVGGTPMSLPEACRLSDALAGQLRTRLNLDPAGEQQVIRLTSLRAQVERIRDQVRAEPPPALDAANAQVAQFAARLEDLVAKRDRGGDVGGLLGPLEIDAARYERDLIVGAAQRRESREVLGRARDQVAALTRREAELRTLVERTLATVSPAPKYAVPDVAALGPIPNTRAGLDAFVARLGQVERAMQVVQDAYSQALAERDQLVTLLEALGAKASALGRGDDEAFTQLVGLARAFLTRAPAPLPSARLLVSAAQAHLGWLTDPQERAR